MPQKQRALSLSAPRDGRSTDVKVSDPNDEEQSHGAQAEDTDWSEGGRDRVGESEGEEVRGSRRRGGLLELRPW